MATASWATRCTSKTANCVFTTTPREAIRFVRSSTSLPEGEISVSFGFAKTGPLQGIGKLFVGDDEIASAMIGPTIGVTFAPLGLSIGMGRASAVTNDYDGRFVYGGKLHEVVFVVGDDRGATEIPTYMND